MKDIKMWRHAGVVKKSTFYCGKKSINPDAPKSLEQETDGARETSDSGRRDFLKRTKRNKLLVIDH
jgi:hypothetical protein